MSLSDDIQILKSVELFKGFNDEQLRLLAFGCQRQIYAKDAEIFHNGAVCEGGLVVASGNLKYMPATTGDTSPPARNHGPGSLVGQLGLVSRVRHHGTAVAGSELEVIRIPRAVFIRMLEEFPDLAQLLHERLAKVVQDDIRQLERIQRRLGP